MAFRRALGFSLLELLLTLTVIGLILVAGALAFREGTERASSRAAAELLAEEMRYARQRAVAAQLPVAVAFPSDGGVNPVSRSFYRLEGWAPTGAAQVRDLSVEFPTTILFNGTWGGARSGDPATGANFEQFDPASWTATEDPLFVFLPSGTSRTNGRPLISGEYHIVVAQGVDYDPGPDGPVLSGAAEPYTVSVSPLGSVRVLRGVVGAGGTVAERVASASVAAARFSGDRLDSPGRANGTPVIEGLEIRPRPNPKMLPEGVDCATLEGGQVTLVVRASDPDGDTLHAAWEHDSRAEAPGDFSPGGRQRLERVATGGAVLSTSVLWQARRLPLDEDLPNPVPEFRYTLRCMVQDDHGGTATKELVVRVLPDRLLPWPALYQDGEGIGMMNADGSGRTGLTSPGSFPAWRAGGSHIAYYISQPVPTIVTMAPNGKERRSLVLGWSAYATSVGPYYGPVRFLYPTVTYLGGATYGYQPQYPRHLSWSPDGRWVTFSDGGHLFALSTTLPPGHPSRLLWLGLGAEPSWSPDGTKIVYMDCYPLYYGYYYGYYYASSRLVGGLSIQRVTSYPSWIQRGPVYPLVQRGPLCWGPVWSPDGRRIIFDTQYFSSTYEIGMAEVPSPLGGTVTPVNLTANPYEDWWPTWSPDGSRIMFSSNRDGNFEVYVMNADGTGQTRLTETIDHDEMYVSWSP